MSASANRAGAPVAAVTTTTGVPGTSAEVRTFTSPARPVYATNCDTTDDLYIKINKDDASSTDFLVKLTPGQAVELSTCGIVNVVTVSLYYASSAYAGAKVVGWLAGG
ncbi:hypothetical protein AMJ85_00230 [candidate division BRC1 bacterium SM23_51]|nr:MAG: hypothetical protein AMJ85_00230 [candidate division BRC1 bacterium SM23_51]